MCFLFLFCVYFHFYIFVNLKEGEKTSFLKEKRIYDPQVQKEQLYLSDQ
jgi:hypothetical protein